MTTFSQGVPVILSAWDFLHVANATDMVNGMNPTTEELCGTNVDVEPNLGFTVRAQKRLQINIWVPPDTQWFSYNIFGTNTLRLGVYYPLLKIEEFIVAGDEYANMVKTQLLHLRVFREALYYGSLTVGPFLFLMGSLSIGLGIKGRRRGYTAVN